MNAPNPRRFALWAALLVLPLAVGSLLVPRLLRGASGPADGASAPRPEQPTAEELERARSTSVALAEAERRGLERAEVLAPRDEAGDVWRPFDGFGLSIDSSPEGARVSVDGQDLGDTPVLQAFPCEPGQVVMVRVEAKGHRRFERRIACRREGVLSFTARLEREAAPAPR